jgi:hypothetical protein
LADDLIPPTQLYVIGVPTVRKIRNTRVYITLSGRQVGQGQRNRAQKAQCIAISQVVRQQLSKQPISVVPLRLLGATREPLADRVAMGRTGSLWDFITAK